ncbi:MAG: DUF4390 domain-containing protein, partial [Pseudomonadota bacterium]
MPACLKNRLPAAALLLLFALPAAADFKVVDVQPRFDGGALLLNGNIDLTLSSKVEEALSKGIQLEVVIDVRLYRPRWFVWHQGIGSWTLRRRISYHALSGQYLVSASETNTETKESHSSAQEALKALGALNDVRLPLAGDDSRDGGGTTSGTKEVERRRATAGMPEVEQRRERLPEQPPRAAPGDRIDAGGRATPGAVAGAAADAPPEGDYSVEVRASLDIEAL